MTENGTVKISIDMELPRQYKEFYDRLIELGDIGDLAEIAAGGVICYLNRIHDELSGILDFIEPEVMKDLSFSP